MSNNNQEPTLAEVLQKLADVWEYFAALCEERADQMLRDLRRHD